MMTTYENKTKALLEVLTDKYFQMESYCDLQDDIDEMIDDLNLDFKIEEFKSQVTKLEEQEFILVGEEDLEDQDIDCSLFETIDDLIELNNYNSDVEELLNFVQTTDLPMWSPKTTRVLRAYRKYRTREIRHFNLEIQNSKAFFQIFDSFGERFGIQAATKLTNSIEENISKLSETVKETVPAFKNTALDIITDVVSTLYVLWRSRDRWDVCAAVLVSCAVRYGFSCDESFFDMFKLPYYVAQSAEDTFANAANIAASFGGIVVFLFALICNKGIPQNFSDVYGLFSVNVLNISSQIGHAKRGLDECKKWVNSVKDNIAQFYTWATTGEWIELPSEKVAKKFQELMTKLRQYDKIDVRHDMILDNNLIDNMVQLIHDAEDFLLEIKNDQQSTDFDICTFRSILVSAKRIHASLVDVASSRAKVRSEPLCILVAGKPNIGKTFMTNQLICYLAKQHNELVNKYGSGETYHVDIENMNASKYTFNRANDFWDGYKNQFATVFDDFGQTVDSQPKPNPEFIEIINCVNCSEYPLHSASIQEKGKVKFNSRFIMLTSNKLSHEPKSISSREALYRRIHLPVEMVVKSAFATPVGALDQSKTAGKSSNDFYEFKLYEPTSLYGDPKNPPSVQSTLSFHDFLKLCSDKYFSNFSKSNNDVCLLKKAVCDFPLARLEMNDAIDEEDAELYEESQEYSYTDLVWETLKAKEPVSDKVYTTYFIAKQFLGEQFSKVLPASLHEWSSSAFSKAEEWISSLADSKTMWCVVFGFVTPILLKYLYDFVKKDVCSNCSAYLASKQDNRAFVKYLQNLKGNCKNCKDIGERFREFKSESDKLRILNIATPEMCSDENAFGIANKINRQMYSVKTESGVHKFNLTMIRGRVGVINRHCADAMKEWKKVKLHPPNFADPFLVNVESCTFHYPKDEQEDFCLIVLPPNVPCARDILDSFATSVELSKFDSVEATLVTLSHAADGSLVHYCTRSGPVKANDQCIEVAMSERRLNEIRKVRVGYEYSISTVSGDCGSFIVANNKLLSRKIIGMHAYGSPSVNGGISLTRPKLEAVLANITKSAQIAMVGEYSQVEECDTALSHCGEAIPNLIPIGRAVPVFAPTKTEISPSPLHDQLEGFPPTMEPSCLVDHRDPPLTKGLKKVANVPLPVDPSLLQSCANHYFYNLPPKENFARVLSDKEMIEGIPGENFQPVCRSSSPGYPYVLRNPGKGKKHWLGEGEEYKYDSELRETVEKRITRARNGERTETIWVDTLKDERRPKEKVAARKTRVFSYAPLDYVLAMRKYFGGFTAFMHKNRVECESCVGIDPYTEWWRVARRLQEVGDHVVAGDFSNFDGSLLLDVLHVIGEKICEWYGSEEELTRLTLYTEVTNSVHLADGIVYGWTHSNPSGNPLTVILNSIFNSIMCRVVFCHATGLNLDAYDKYVRAVNYGDDNVLSIHPALIEKFNQLTMTESFRYFGLTYTDEQKSGTLVAYRHLSEVAFLKRSFVKRNGQWLAPLSLVTILEMVQWQRKSVDKLGDCAVVVEKALCELALHDAVTFEKISMVILDACKKCGVKPKRYDQFTLAARLTNPHVDLRGFAQISDSSCGSSVSEKTDVENILPKTTTVSISWIMAQVTSNMNAEQKIVRQTKFREVMDNHFAKNGPVGWQYYQLVKSDLAKDLICQIVAEENERPFFQAQSSLEKIIKKTNNPTIQSGLESAARCEVSQRKTLSCERIRKVASRKSRALGPTSTSSNVNLSSRKDKQRTQARKEDIRAKRDMCGAAFELNRSGDVTTTVVRRVVEASLDETPHVSPLVPLGGFVWNVVSAMLYFKAACSANQFFTMMFVAGWFTSQGVKQEHAQVYADRYWKRFAPYVSPFVEEIIYSLNPKMKLTFAVQEMAHKIKSHGFSVMQLIPFSMHIATALIPFWARIPLHYVCNAIAVASLPDFGVSIVKTERGVRVFEFGRKITVKDGVAVFADHGDYNAIPHYQSALKHDILPDYYTVLDLAGTGVEESSDDAIPTYHETLEDTSNGSELMQHGSNETTVKVENLGPAPGINTYYNDVKASLEREVVVYQSEWSTDDVPATALATCQMPQLLFEKNPFFRNRTSYFAYLKANIEMKVMVNATKLSCGQLYFCFSQAAEEAGVYNDALTFIRGFTCLPGVRIKAQTGATGVLAVPYCYPTKGFGMNSGEGTFGTGHLFVTNILKGIPKCSYTISARFVEPELSVQDSGETVYNVQRALALQGVGIEETVAAGKGFFSKVMGIATPVARVLSNVPVIGPIASTIGKIGELFGFDKPADVRAPMPVSQMPAKNWTNWSNVDGGAILGQTGEADAGYNSSLGLIEADEMSLEHVLGQSALMYEIPWSTSDAVNTIIKQIDVTALDAEYVTGDLGKIIQTDLIGYVANYFSFWRGDLVYEFDPINCFTISGKLRIAVGPPTSAHPKTSDDLNNLPNFILDLQATDPIVRIPASFMANAQWLPVSQGIFSCHIYVGVINALVSSTPDIDTIDVNVWRWGGRSLDFSVPKQSLNVPVFQMRQESGEVNFEPYEDKHRDDAICERLYTLREVIKRASPIRTYNLNNGTMWSFDPLAFGTNDSAMSYFAPLFRYFRGGKRYKISCDKNIGELRVSLTYGPYSTEEVGSYVEHPHVAQYRTNLAINPYMEFTIPWYYPYPLCFVQKAATPTTLDDKACRPRVHVSYISPESSKEPKNWGDPLDVEKVKITNKLEYSNGQWELWVPTDIDSGTLVEGQTIRIDSQIFVTTTATGYQLDQFILAPGDHTVIMPEGTSATMSFTRLLSTEVQSDACTVTLWECASDDASFSWLIGPQRLAVTERPDVVHQEVCP